MEKYIQFQIAKINTVQFATVESAYPEVPGTKVETTSRLYFNIDHTNKYIRCGIDIGFENEKAPFIILDVNCEFSIAQESWQSCLIEDNKIEFEKGFVQHLAVLTIGTARGVLHAKTENTKFNKYLLPTLNLTELFQENITFEIAK